MTVARFRNHREAAMALLTSGAPLSRKEGQFAGGCAFDDGTLSEKQLRWMDILLDRYGVEPDTGEAHALAVPEGQLH
ncbi:MAG: hypothetical protein JWQ16_2542 [Novosphingobium sp.]|nr:hypothetical protein [Novosphingobium sp.]